jgi:hypothetical protein
MLRVGVRVMPVTPVGPWHYFQTLHNDVQQTQAPTDNKRFVCNELCNTHHSADCTGIAEVPMALMSPESCGNVAILNRPAADNVGCTARNSFAASCGLCILQLLWQRTRAGRAIRLQRDVQYTKGIDCVVQSEYVNGTNAARSCVEEPRSNKTFQQLPTHELHGWWQPRTQPPVTCHHRDGIGSKRVPWKAPSDGTADLKTSLFLGAGDSPEHLKTSG